MSRAVDLEASELGALLFKLRQDRLLMVGLAALLLLS